MKNTVIFLTLFLFIFYQEIPYALNKRLKPPPPPVKEVTNIVADSNLYKQCKATVFPSFINNSMYWGDGFGEPAGRSIYRAFNSISPPSIVVTAAGNLHPKSVPPYKTKASKDFDAIIVGSLAPDGKRSLFSQQGEAVHIIAPADYQQISANEDGSHRRLGGTSGATPLVTGSLAGFEWMAGYHPTAAEAKILLKKTAIPTLSSNDEPQKNGVGMVNAYKLGMVGQKLKKLCGSSVRCFRDLINSDHIYKFPEDSGLSEALNQAFPECSRTVCNSNNNNSSAMCSDKATIVERLRKAAFLNPQNKELWRNLACVYASGGFAENSKGIMSFYRAISEKNTNMRFKGDQYCSVDEDCTFVPDCNRNHNHNKGPTFCYRKENGQTICEHQEIIKKGIVEIGGAGGGEEELLPQKLLSMNKTMAEVYYMENCLENKTLCNNKCRCGNTEEVKVLSDNNGFGIVSHNMYKSKCINSQCVKVDIAISPEPVINYPKPVLTPIQKKGAGSIQ